MAKRGEKRKVKIKGKKKHKPGKSTNKQSAYQIQGDRLVKIKRECPKCGAGVFMAEHKDRFHCGKCSFTEFKKR